jgi:hypothetical protein
MTEFPRRQPARLGAEHKSNAPRCAAPTCSGNAKTALAPQSWTAGVYPGHRIIVAASKSGPTRVDGSPQRRCTVPHRDELQLLERSLVTSEVAEIPRTPFSASTLTPTAAGRQCAAAAPHRRRSRPPTPRSVASAGCRPMRSMTRHKDPGLSHTGRPVRSWERIPGSRKEVDIQEFFPPPPPPPHPGDERGTRAGRGLERQGNEDASRRLQRYDMTRPADSASQGPVR